MGLAHRSLQLERHELIHFGRKLEWQLVEDLSAEPRDDHPHCLLGVDAPLLEVEELVLPDLGRRGLVLHPRTGVLDLPAREGGRRGGRGGGLHTVIHSRVQWSVSGRAEDPGSTHRWRTSRSNRKAETRTQKYTVTKAGRQTSKHVKENMESSRQRDMGRRRDVTTCIE